MQEMTNRRLGAYAQSLTHVSSTRGLRRMGIMLAVVVLCSAVLAQVAHASTLTCGNASCQNVTGKGLRVDTVQPLVWLPPNIKYIGHSETWGPGFHANTPDQLFYNASNINWAQANTLGGNRNWSLYRDFPQNSKICTRFWRKAGPGNYFSLGTACAEIHR